jgi:CheY-like chemotaxis protein
LGDGSAGAASSGAEALDVVAARGSSFDVAVLDMHMPDMDGVTLAREIRKLRSEIEMPLDNAVLAGGAGHLRRDGLFAAHLTKPAKPAKILEVLAGLFRSVPMPQATGYTAHRLLPPSATSRAERILLAEDNAVNQKVALMILDRLGYRADIAANGHEVIEALDRQPYDIVLMDVQMPEMDGIEATRAIIARMPDPGTRPWIVALTANAMQGDREMCLAAGMDDYISKPMRREELEAALLRGRERRRSPRA